MSLKYLDNNFREFLEYFFFLGEFNTVAGSKDKLKYALDGLCKLIYKEISEQELIYSFQKLKSRGYPVDDLSDFKKKFEQLNVTSIRLLVGSKMIMDKEILHCLGDFLKYLPRLIRFRLGGIKFNSNIPKYFSKSLLVSNITSLSITSCGICFFPDHFIKAIRESKIEQLDITGNKFRDYFFSIKQGEKGGLCKILEKSKIRDFEFGNFFDQKEKQNERLKCLLYILKTSPKLESLYLNVEEHIRGIPAAEYKIKFDAGFARFMKKLRESVKKNRNLNRFFMGVIYRDFNGYTFYEDFVEIRKRLSENKKMINSCLLSLKLGIIKKIMSVRWSHSDILVDRKIPELLMKYDIEKIHENFRSYLQLEWNKTPFFRKKK